MHLKLMTGIFFFVILPVNMENIFALLLKIVFNQTVISIIENT